MKKILKVEQIQKYYGNKENITKAIDGISFDVEEGEFIGIMGASGSGKTTLLNCISTIDNVSSGHIYLDGKDITEIKEENIAKFRRENLGFIFQDFNLLDTLTIEENIALILTINKVQEKEIDKKILQIAEKLGIKDILNKYPYQVSGGQKQRCASARAIVNNPKIADVIVINTCGFIESAKEEAINTILEMAEYKKTGKCKVLIATGCLVERYKEDLEKALPEVDIFLKYSDYAEEKGNSSVVFAKVLKEVYDKIESKKNVKLVDTDLNFMNRVITTGEQYSYIRIAEGCSNRCTYCAIPYIRGNFVSRKMEDIIEEAKQIVSTGRRELILIAQDTSKYGKDIYGKPKLAELLTELCKIKDLKWVRFLYTYPEDITDELIKVVKENDKICKYFDIPIQHISDTVLKRMNRKCTGQSIKNTISKLRKEIPDVVIRTTLMVGFPGETQEDFEKLYEFVKETKFDKLGAFTYSKEDGTPASRLKEQIHPMTKKSRYNKIMKLQQEISKENEKKNIGRELEILIEGITPDKKYYVGRSYMDVPDIDGVAYVKNTSNEDLIGKYIKAKVVEVKDYDLILVEK